MVLQEHFFTSAHQIKFISIKVSEEGSMQTHFFLCSTVSSFAASPKSPNRKSMFSFTKKLPAKTNWSIIKPTELDGCHAMIQTAG